MENVTVDAQGNFSLSNTTAYAVAYTTAAGTIKLTVELVDNLGDKNSESVMLTSDLVTAIGDIAFTAHITTYPNPVYHVLNISLPLQFTNRDMSLFNSLGQLCLTATLQGENNQVDVSSLKPGVYLVVMKDNDGSRRTIKIIKK